MKILLQLVFLYLLYKFIFDFIIPLYQTTKQVKRKVNKMEEDMREHMYKQNNNTFNQQNTTASRPVKDDYIDYEELK